MADAGGGPAAAAARSGEQGGDGKDTERINREVQSRARVLCFSAWVPDYQKARTLALQRLGPHGWVPARSSQWELLTNGRGPPPGRRSDTVV